MAAFVDESVRHGGVGTYVIGCVIVPDDLLHDHREALEKKPLFHFSDADEAHRFEMLTYIGVSGLVSCGYYLRGSRRMGEENARRECLGRLLEDLRDWDVHDLILETRRERQNTLDAISIMGFKKRGRTPDPIGYEWRPKAERLLSMADAIAGAVRVYDEALKVIETGVREVRP